MQIRMTVAFDQEHGGKEYQITCGSRDILAWEKAGPGRAAAQVINLSSFRLDDLYSLAFATLRRQGVWGGKESELREHAEIDLGHARLTEEEAEAEEQAEADPTPLARSADES
jgi:hypothetical protein